MLNAEIISALTPQRRPLYILQPWQRQLWIVTPEPSARILINTLWIIIPLSYNLLLWYSFMFIDKLLNILSLSISLSTDSWLHFNVRRGEILSNQFRDDVWSTCRVPHPSLLSRQGLLLQINSHPNSSQCWVVTDPIQWPKISLQPRFEAAHFPLY